MREAFRQASVGAALLAVFALVGTVLVAVTEHQARDRIERNEREFLLRTLDLLVDPACYDNDPLADTLEVDAHDALGGEQPVTVYRAAHDGQAVAAVMTITAPDGYSGDIRMLLGVDAGGTITGVRVLSHRETPGLGDAIEAGRSDWILGFAGRSLEDPARRRWTVKKDGGAFDQFTGATITPRAVIEAIERALVYFESEREHLFAPHTLPPDDSGPACRPRP